MLERVRRSLVDMNTRNLTQLKVLPAESLPGDRAHVEIYKPYFAAGVICVLTVGCLLGAIALFKISLLSSYTATELTPLIWAHANSQLFGWVGFFVMGFALQMHGTTVQKSRSFHRLAYISLGLMSLGIILRFVAEPLAQSTPSIGIPIGLAACVSQIIAVFVFHFNSGVNRFRTGAGLTWQTTFIFASLFWFTVVTLAEPVVFLNTHLANPQESVLFIARWFTPYRETQFLGFVAMMIYGVALVKMSSCFGFKSAEKWSGITGFVLWSLGLLIRIFGWLFFFDSGMKAGSDNWMRIGSSFLMLGAVFVVISLKVFEKSTLTLRAHKFIRAAFAWLLIGGVLLVLEPLHLRFLSLPFSHAYTGGIRHAITVGFISQMILGVSLRVVSESCRLDESNLNPLWLAFIMLNLGNLGRVALEISTDYSPWGFKLMGFTGFIELSALVIWAIALAAPVFAQIRSRKAYA